ERKTEPRQFRKAARGEGRARGSAELFSLDDATGNGEHILYRSANFRTDEVGRIIGAEGGQADRMGKGFRDRVIFAGKCHGSWQSARDFRGKARAGENGGQ